MHQHSRHISTRASALPSLYAFDLDGTITTREILPCIAEHLGLVEELTELTRLTLRGDLDFASSFRRRFRMLRSVPLAKVHATIAEVPLDPAIEAFIKAHRDRCVVVTGNLDLWVAPLLQRLGCRYFSSTAAVTGGELTLTAVLDKGQAMQTLAKEGRPIVAIGESVNDIPMFERASTCIAFAGVHDPVPQLRSMAHYTISDGESLCALLRTL